MIDGDVEFEFVISYLILIHWKKHTSTYIFTKLIYTVYIYKAIHTIHCSFHLKNEH